MKKRYVKPKGPINYGRIRAALRKVWLYSEPRQECVKAARKSRGLYQCNECKKLFKIKEVQCDHIMDIGKFIDWNTFVERLFCPASNLQMLCKGCHQIKTNIATKLRAEQNKKAKKAKKTTKG